MSTTLLYQSITGRDEPPGPPGEPLDPVEAARMVNCPVCWAAPQRRCSLAGKPAMHLGRYRRANRRGLLSEEALHEIESGFDKPEDWTYVLDDLVIPEQEGN